MWRGSYSFAFGRRCSALYRPSSRGMSYIQDRLARWTQLQQQVGPDHVATGPIAIRLPGTPEPVSGVANQTTLLDALQQHPQYADLIEKNIVAGEIDGQLIELNRPLTQNTNVARFIPFYSPLGRNLFWHSSAHLLGYALEQLYSEDYGTPENWKTEGMPPRAKIARTVLLDDGPPLEAGGFFYDFEFGGNSSQPFESINKSDLKRVNKWMTFLRDQEEPFERLELDKASALELFAYNPHKVNILQRLEENATISCYRLGQFIDLCRGPHLPHAGYVRWFDLRGVSSVEMAEKEGARMNRVTGISFPHPDMKETWEKQREDEKENDHRTIGKTQQLFMSHPYSAGSPFFLPHGVTIYSQLQQYLSQQYKERGYQEVMTPNIFLKDLWETSGHWQNYKENMFTVLSNHHMTKEHGSAAESFQQQSEKEHGDHEHFCLKPMNCPAHCLIFDHQTRSYKDMPIRFAEFGVLHRDELAGTLTGLTRVRRFVQDDAHIFCRQDQIAEEVKSCLDFVRSVYGMFGFEFSLALSTRPEKALGSLEQWNAAETALKEQLAESGLTWSIKEGDGAFYGPKIDVTITDVHHRDHQCATIQLDFQLPQRFKLHYVGADGQKHMPIMIHRAILGSFERFIAILAEHTRGRWPLWLSPRQCVVCSVNPKAHSYAETVAKTLQGHGIRTEQNISDDRLTKKIKEATELRFNYIVIVGEKEEETQQISWRERGHTETHHASLTEFNNMLQGKINEFE